MLTKDYDLKMYKNKNNFGLNIDNFVNTFNFNNIMMREKIIVFCIVLLLCCPTISIMMSNNATSGLPDIPTDAKINGTYIYQITSLLSNITRLYQPNELMKGRSFGSKGEDFAAEYIIKREMINLSLYSPDELNIPYLQPIKNV